MATQRSMVYWLCAFKEEQHNAAYSLMYCSFPTLNALIQMRMIYHSSGREADPKWFAIYSKVHPVDCDSFDSMPHCSVCVSAPQPTTSCQAGFCWGGIFVCLLLYSECGNWCQPIGWSITLHWCEWVKCKLRLQSPWNSTETTAVSARNSIRLGSCGSILDNTSSELQIYTSLLYRKCGYDIVSNFVHFTDVLCISQYSLLK